MNDGLGKDCMVLLTCGPKPDTSLVSRRGSGFSYGLFGRCAPMAMAGGVGPICPEIPNPAPLVLSETTLRTYGNQTDRSVYAIY